MLIFLGFLVSLDAFFVGLSLGLQKKCKFMQLVYINTFLLFLCMLGFFLADLFSKVGDFSFAVGIGFTAIGLWTILKPTQKNLVKQKNNAWLPVGLFMSIEAMFITTGLVFIFGSFIVAPIVIAFAHFGYSALAFFLSRTAYVQKMPHAISHIVSGLCLIAYGILALVL